MRPSPNLDAQELRRTLYVRIDALEKKYNHHTLQTIAMNLRESGAQYSALLRETVDTICKEHTEICGLFEELDRMLSTGINALYAIAPRDAVAMQQAESKQELLDCMHENRRKIFRRAFASVGRQCKGTIHPNHILEQLNLLDEFLIEIRYWLGLPIYSPEVQ